MSSASPGKRNSRHIHHRRSANFRLWIAMSFFVIFCFVYIQRASDVFSHGQPTELEPRSRGAKNKQLAHIDQVNFNRQTEQFLTYPKIVLMPLLGMANRLRTMKSFAVMKQCSDIKHYRLETFTTWLPTFDLFASYDEIFASRNLKHLSFDSIREAERGFVLLTHESNSVTPEILSQFLGMDEELVLRHRDIYEVQKINIQQLLRKYMSLDYIVLASAWGTYSVGDRYSHCSRRTKNLLKRGFLKSMKFQPSIQTHLDTFSKQVDQVRLNGGRVIGLHIRLTDSTTRGEKEYQLAATSIEFTLDIMRQIFAAKEHQNDVLFIASDTPEALAVFGQEESFVGKVLFHQPDFGHPSSLRSDRSKLSGILSGAVDLMSLSLCDEVWGNNKLSSFTRLAAELGGNKEKMVIDY